MSLLASARETDSGTGRQSPAPEPIINQSEPIGGFIDNWFAFANIDEVVESSIRQPSCAPAGMQEVVCPSSSQHPTREKEFRPMQKKILPVIPLRAPCLLKP
jgi:hypothetical protein